MTDIPIAQNVGMDLTQIIEAHEGLSGHVLYLDGEKFESAFDSGVEAATLHLSNTMLHDSKLIVIISKQRNVAFVAKADAISLDTLPQVIGQPVVSLDV